MFCKKGVPKNILSIVAFSIISLLFIKKTPKQVFFHEICEILMNTYSFKLYLVDLTVFPDLNLRLAKIKPFTTVSISKFSRFYCHTSSFLCYQVRKLRNFVFFKRFQLTSTVTCFSGLSLISIIL